METNEETFKKHKIFFLTEGIFVRDAEDILNFVAASFNISKTSLDSYEKNTENLSINKSFNGNSEESHVAIKLFICIESSDIKENHYNISFYHALFAAYYRNLGVFLNQSRFDLSLKLNEKFIETFELLRKHINNEIITEVKRQHNISLTLNFSLIDLILINLDKFKSINLDPVHYKENLKQLQ
jgi:hypothetical protein